MALVPLLPTQFINAGSEKILQVTVAPPAGTSSAAVLERAIEAETILLADPEVELVQTSVPGEGDTSFGTVTAAFSGRPANSATLTVRLERRRRPRRRTPSSSRPPSPRSRPTATTSPSPRRPGSRRTA